MLNLFKRLEDMSLAACFAQANDVKTSIKVLNKGLAIDHISLRRNRTETSYDDETRSGEGRSHYKYYYAQSR